ncbi:hypothetical protein VTN77DRAFT_482 [Rasamsonia byssochlamydoides]|uniref:uncharacterized protein n=1 Tax=Rasamsonia byssochlamydoides TaxID=89139 RepID=UPI0037446DDF
MSYAYPHGSPAAAMPPRSSYRNHFVEPPSLLARVQDALPTELQDWIADIRSRLGYGGRRRADRRGFWQELRSMVRRAVCVANLLILIWIFTLRWGERTIFQESVSRCAWETWERWPQHATPHHVVFVADPQLVDPHTYPGRPWPLSTLTVRYTDQYLRRAFSSIEQMLVPDSVFFLGDLFDGGREWATSTSTSPEKRYRKYGDKFWLKEYDRFARIFFRTWNQRKARSGADPRGRKLVASLPGNHDLGFGTGIQDPVRRRFQAYFGRGNRVDIVGNHTFVSVDTVSLSAMDQPDPETGSSGTGAGDGHQPNANIWGATEDFLNGVKAQKARLETEALRMLRNQSEGYLFRPGIVEPSESTVYQMREVTSPGFPTILLTHVPLYRKPATPCGPLRERYPPSSTDPYPEEDERNAISIHGGYQYQNVLTQTISNELISKVGPEIVHIYSGDDHDYCEIAHREFSGSPKEITVKSLSWAMGVRHPGFVMTTLWNPIDPDTGRPINGESSSPTLQNHLCLLPDQLGIFIRYACLFLFTLLVLLIRAVIVTFLPYGKPSSSEPTLPYTEHRPFHSPPAESTSPSASVSSSTSCSAELESRLASRGLIREATNATRYSQDDDRRYRDEKWKSKPVPSREGLGGPASTCSSAWDEFVRSAKYVAAVVLPYYLWLIWRW